MINLKIYRYEGTNLKLPDDCYWEYIGHDLYIVSTKSKGPNKILVKQGSLIVIATSKEDDTNIVVLDTPGFDKEGREF